MQEVTGKHRKQCFFVYSGYSLILIYPVILVIIDDFHLNLRKFSFAHMYTICLECPDWFDIFIAPLVPFGSDGGPSVTCEMVIQIRSYMLWMYGVHDCFERSYSYVQAIAKQFSLSIDFCQENRIDYCWHSNYLTNPEKFFSLESFYKMRVDRFSDSLTHTEKVGSDGFEIDYVSIGKRSKTGNFDFYSAWMIFKYAGRFSACSP